MTEHLDPRIADLLGLDLADPAVRDGVADTSALMDLITALVVRREAAGLSHADVAAAMETGVEEVADFERVGGDPTVAFAQRYARAVGGSLDVDISEQPDTDHVTWVKPSEFARINASLDGPAEPNVRVRAAAEQLRGERNHRTIRARMRPQTAEATAVQLSTEPAPAHPSGYTIGVYLPPGVSEEVRDRLADCIAAMAQQAVHGADVVGQAGDPLGAVDGVPRP